MDNPTESGASGVWTGRVWDLGASPVPPANLDAARVGRDTDRDFDAYPDPDGFTDDDALAFVLDRCDDFGLPESVRSYVRGLDPSLLRNSLLRHLGIPVCDRPVPGSPRGFCGLCWPRPCPPSGSPRRAASEALTC